jgi:exonuclease III
MPMFNIESWNIKGLNGPLKHKVVKTWIKLHDHNLVGILEIKIASNYEEGLG